MSHASHPRVTGNWIPADGTKSTLEGASTEDRNVFAMRSSVDPNHEIYATPGQVHNLVKAIDAGKLPERGK